MILQGIDVIQKEDFKTLINKRIGLITNYSFINNKMEDGIELLLKNKVNVVKVFTPEHGLYGLADGKEYDDQIHPKYKIPVISLYGKNKKPTSNMLEDLDALVYDIQSVGLRFYTFIYTLAYCMQAACQNNKKFIVLDRINPLGRLVFGSRIKDEFSTFVGGYELPLRYGLTVGELSKYYKKLLKLDMDLVVIKNEGWNGETFDNTNLKWNVPSPALATFESTLAYSGMCLLEGTNVSEGRGSPKPFCFIGAPWLDENLLYEFLKKRFSELIFRKRYFIPNFSKYNGEICKGIEFFPEIKDNFTIIAIELIRYLTEFGEFRFTNYIDRESRLKKEHIENLIGTDKSLFFKRDNNFLYEWEKSAEEFIDYCSDILLYGGLSLWKI